ncbi:uncharacterized protein LOC126976156 isoform X2 [Leptidea sinapis]|uniref:uncharacterized protein LOC126976156 isoform X2 n=1 Tax=Leptidea sinapis TaxID=189913 RepID=UPI0021C40F7A|nr:uncharacterized protein LOC126976156 isoform X2 [Leptidea sinapis]
MLLIIHNVPVQMRYSDVRDFLISKSGIQQLILDNLIHEKSGSKQQVTVGLVDESDAAIFVRKINNLYLDGEPIYIENVGQKMELEQPYRPPQYHTQSRKDVESTVEQYSLLKPNRTDFGNKHALMISTLPPVGNIPSYTPMIKQLEAQPTPVSTFPQNSYFLQPDGHAVFQPNSLWFSSTQENRDDQSYFDQRPQNLRLQSSTHENRDDQSYSDQRPLKRGFQNCTHENRDDQSYSDQKSQKRRLQSSTHEIRDDKSYFDQKPQKRRLQSRTHENKDDKSYFDQKPQNLRLQSSTHENRDDQSYSDQRPLKRGFQNCTHENRDDQSYSDQKSQKRRLQSSTHEIRDDKSYFDQKPQKRRLQSRTHENKDDKSYFDQKPQKRRLQSSTHEVRDDQSYFDQKPQKCRFKSSTHENRDDQSYFDQNPLKRRFQSSTHENRDDQSYFDQKPQKRRFQRSTHEIRDDQSYLDQKTHNRRLQSGFVSFSHSEECDRNPKYEKKSHSHFSGSEIKEPNPNVVNQNSPESHVKLNYVKNLLNSRHIFNLNHAASQIANEIMANLEILSNDSTDFNNKLKNKILIRLKGLYVNGSCLSQEQAVAEYREKYPASEDRLFIEFVAEQEGFSKKIAYNINTPKDAQISHPHPFTAKRKISNVKKLQDESCVTPYEVKNENHSYILNFIAKKLANDMIKNIKAKTLSNYPYNNITQVSLKKAVRNRLDDIYLNRTCYSNKQALRDYRNKFPTSDDESFVKGYVEQKEFFKLRRKAKRERAYHKLLEGREIIKNAQNTPFDEKNLPDEDEEKKEDLMGGDVEVLSPTDRKALNQEMSLIRNLLTELGASKNFPRLTWKYFCDDFEEIMTIRAEKLMRNKSRFLFVKVECNPPQDYLGMEAIEAFLKQRCGITAKITAREKIWMVCCESFDVFDKLCNVGKVFIGKVRVSFEPFKLSIHKNRPRYAEIQFLMSSSSEKDIVVPKYNNDDYFDDCKDFIIPTTEDNQNAKEAKLTEDDCNEIICDEKTVDGSHGVHKENVAVTPTNNDDAVVLDNPYENNPISDIICNIETVNRSLEKIELIEPNQDLVINEDDLEEF